MGGIAFNLAVYIISIFSLKEFIDIKGTRKPIPNFIQFISYIFMTLLILVDVTSISTTYSLDYRVLAALFLSYLLPAVIYHDPKKYSIKDAFYMIGGVLFLGISMALLIMLRESGLKLFIFLFTITITTDTFAYIGGRLVGKHKLLETISPNKTWEGLIIGTIMGVFVSSMYYHTCIDPEFNKILLLMITTFLSLIGQFGDLSFSAIKRYFGKKDFSNLIPGHGGILDRLDSIIFVLLGFTFFIGIM
jgi:phosphatidate cytidylyltransferase